MNLLQLKQNINRIDRRNIFFIIVPEIIFDHYHVIVFEGISQISQ